MASLLREAVRVRIQPDYARWLLEAFPTSAVKPSSGIDFPLKKPFMLEALSRREIEILQLIADGLSNKEIAQKLVISVRTVKYHTTSIYTKLNATGRAHAVAIGRELGLL